VRLNVARDMLRQANRIMDRMENREGSPAAPAAGGRSAAQPVPSEPEEMEESEVGAAAAAAAAAGVGSIQPESLEARAGEALSLSSGPIHIEMMSIPVTSENMMTPPGLAEALSAMFQGTIFQLRYLAFASVIS
jgi:hypothetical protein